MSKGDYFAGIIELPAPFGVFIAELILWNSHLREEVKNIAALIEEMLLITFFLGDILI